MSPLLRRSIPAAILTALALAVPLAVGTTPAAADDGPIASAPVAVADGPSESSTRQPRGSFGAPVNVSVSTNERGMTVFASPVCSGWKSCRSWFVIPGSGVDVKDVSTSNGYFVAWPASWREGQTNSAGYVRSYGRDVFGYGWYSGATTSLGSVTRPYAARTLTVRLSSQDDATRTATVTGTGTPGATIRRNGATIATVAQNGSWTARVAGLPSGTSVLTFQQYIGSTYRDQASVSVAFAAQDLIVGVTGATTTLAPGVDTLVFGRLRATAPVTAPLRAATVVFTAPAGTTFPTDTTSIRGEYRPASGGDWKQFAADSLVDGVVSADGRTATFRWSATASTGWSLSTGTDVRFGVPVHNPGSAPADDEGELRMTAVGAAPEGSFDTVASTPVLIEAGSLDPVAVTGPSTVIPGATNTVTGTATPNADFQVLGTDGSVIVPGGPFTVGAAGVWRFTTDVPSGSTRFEFVIEQTANGRTARSDVFSIPADTFHRVTVTTTSARDGVRNSFSGTATPGATYRVVNAWGTEIVAGGPFRVETNGKWVFDRVVSTGATKFDFRIEQTWKGRSSVSELFSIPTAQHSPCTHDMTKVKCRM